MTIIALTNFLTISDIDGNIQYKFQNGKYDGMINSYKYLSFIYQGAAMSRSGDNLEAAIILGNVGSREGVTGQVNRLSMNYAKEAVENRWSISVDTCLMDSSFTAISKVLTHEQWLASSMSYDKESIEILCSSAVDAVGSNCPNKVLHFDQVGYLPVTGNIQNR